MNSNSLYKRKNEGYPPPNWIKKLYNIIVIIVIFELLFFS